MPRLKMYEVSAEGTGDQFQSYGNWDFGNHTLHRVKLANYSMANTYTNTETKTASVVTAMESAEGDDIRYIYKNVSSVNNRIILSIPNKYKGKSYTIVGVAKKGFGDYSIVEEDLDKFIIETDRDLTITVEISIDLGKQED